MSCRLSLPAALSAVLALVCVAVLTACGSSSAGGPDGPTRTVVDIDGTEMEVPVDPRRVVTLSEPTLDGALALGVTPVGTVTGRGQATVPHYLIEQAGDIPLLGGIAQPNFEAIAAAEPDLILVDGTSINNNPDAMEVLRRIAPTFYAGYAGGDWRETFELTALALNKVAEGEQVLAHYDTAVAEAREQLADYADDTFSIVRWQGGGAALILKDLPAGVALDDLGLRRPASQDRRGRGHSEPVSLENLADIDADHMFFGTLGGSSVGNPSAGGEAGTTDAEQALADARGTAGFEDLRAVRSGNVHAVDGSRWTSTGGPVLMQGLVADVLAALT